MSLDLKAHGSKPLRSNFSLHRYSEVWGTSAAPLPTRKWCHVAFSLGLDRLMRFYIDGQLDSVVEVVGDAMANNGGAVQVESS
jgi:hypothetical protein